VQRIGLGSITLLPGPTPWAPTALRVRSRGWSKTHNLHGVPSQARYAKRCASCHIVGQGDHVGPGLNGIATSRDAAGFRVASRLLSSAGEVKAIDPDTIDGQVRDRMALALISRGPQARALTPPARDMASVTLRGTASVRTNSAASSFLPERQRSSEEDRAQWRSPL
jgi:hypothetical protein